MAPLFFFLVPLSYSQSFCLFVSPSVHIPICQFISVSLFTSIFLYFSSCSLLLSSYFLWILSPFFFFFLLIFSYVPSPSFLYINISILRLSSLISSCPFTSSIAVFETGQMMVFILIAKGWTITRDNFAANEWRGVIVALSAFYMSNSIILVLQVHL